ncbi:hypothetical protein U1Q18_048874 [Sarracenia purpurea var. burkii]
MEILGRSSPLKAACLSAEFSKLGGGGGSSSGGFASNPNCCFAFANEYSLSPFSSQKISLRHRKSVILATKKNDKKNDKKVDAHSFIPKPDETTGFFPEAVLLKEKKVQEDGRLLPEFANAEERELFEQLNLQLESELDVEQMRHYEVVYLIHEDHVKEVESVNLKVQDFIKERKGRVWRFSDWGVRRLAYKIKKAKNAHYILMNFELEAKWINDFKNMLDKDERVIRHLVMKKDKAETEDCTPPPEFHTLRAGMDDDDDDDDDDDEYVIDDEDDGEDWDDKGGLDEVGNGNDTGEANMHVEDGFIGKERGEGVDSNKTGRMKLRHKHVVR